MTGIRQACPVVEWRRGSPAPALRSGVIHLWRIGLSGDAWPATPEAMRHVLHPDEIERAGRFRSEHLRQHFVRCRWALRVILGRYTGQAPSDLAFAYQEHGKPVLRRIGQEPGEPPHFNLSHSGSMALLGAALETPVGVDVEEVRRLADADRVAKRVFAADEYEAYHSLDHDARVVAFFNGWTRKEAFIKAVGDGLSYPLERFAVTLEPGTPARLVRVDGSPGEAARWSLHAFEPSAGYCAAVAVRRGDVAFEYFDFC